MALYPWYPKEAEKANWDIYDDLKLKKPFGLHGLYKQSVTMVTYSSAVTACSHTPRNYVFRSK